MYFSGLGRYNEQVSDFYLENYLFFLISIQNLDQMYYSKMQFPYYKGNPCKSLVNTYKVHDRKVI